MLFAETIYALTGVALFGLGLRGALLQRALLGRILAINICGAGVFLVLVSIAYRGGRGWCRMPCRMPWC